MGYIFPHTFDAGDTSRLDGTQRDDQVFRVVVIDRI